MPKLSAQRAAVIEAGVDDADVWEDDEGRKKRDEWILTGRAIEEGDTLVVPLLAALSAAKERRTVMRKIERLGVHVEDMKADVVKVKRTGRPAKFQPSAEDKAAICALWQDKNVPRANVLAEAERRVGEEVHISIIKRWCGMARAKK